MSDPITEPGYRFAQHTWPGDGVTTLREFNFAGGYLSWEHLQAWLISDIGTPDETQVELILTEDNFPSANQFLLTPAVPTGAAVRLVRNTPKDQPLLMYTDGAILNERNLDTTTRQAILGMGEMADEFANLSDSVDVRIEAIGDEAAAATALAQSAQAAAEAAAQDAQGAAASAASALNAAENAQDAAESVLGLVGEVTEAANNATAAAGAATAAAGVATQAAQDATDTAAAAESTAADALAVATGIAGTAASAVTIAEAAQTAAAGAVSTANAAAATANGIDAKATEALDNSEDALTLATNANDAVQGAAMLTGADFTGPVSISGSFRQHDGADPLFTRHSNALGGLKAIALQRGRGTRQAPAALLANDRIAGFFYSAHTGTEYNNFFSMEATATGNWSPTSVPARFMFQKAPAGATGRANVLSFEPDNSIVGYENADFRKALSVGGALTVGSDATITGAAEVGSTLTIAGATFLGQFTQATLPTASANAGATAWCVDTASGEAMVECNGTEWLVCKNGLPVDLAPYVENRTGSATYMAWRYGNGQLVQQVLYTATGLGADSAAAWSITYLVPFVGDVPSLSTNMLAPHSEFVRIGWEGATLTGASGFVFNRSSSTVNLNYRFMAIGRWK